MFDNATTDDLAVSRRREMVVCSVIPGPTGPEARVSVIRRSVPRTMGQWRSIGPFLPVAAIMVDPTVIEEVTGIKVPCRLGLKTAAVLFGHIDIPDDLMRPFARQYVHLGADARPLFRAWHSAVSTARA